MALDKRRRAKANAVLDAMSERSLSLRKACVEVGISNTTFLRWCGDDDTLAKQYARTRTELLAAMEEDLLDICDEDPGTTMTGGKDGAAVQHQRLRVDTRKWLLSKLLPKRYGDRVGVDNDDDADDGRTAEVVDWTPRVVE